ncbi:hypothetical protein Pelo_3408 [Pelomyxa schiedti]|nr:hypothetical protein Pelo_3408 [Pelomyxa schiedti]
MVLMTVRDRDELVALRSFQCTRMLREFKPTNGQHVPGHREKYLPGSVPLDAVNVCLDNNFHTCSWVCEHWKCCALGFDLSGGPPTAPPSLPLLALPSLPLLALPPPGGGGDQEAPRQPPARRRRIDERRYLGASRGGGGGGVGGEWKVPKIGSTSAAATPATTSATTTTTTASMPSAATPAAEPTMSENDEVVVRALYRRNELPQSGSLGRDNLSGEVRKLISAMNFSVRDNGSDQPYTKLAWETGGRIYVEIVARVREGTVRTTHGSVRLSVVIGDQGEEHLVALISAARKSQFSPVHSVKILSSVHEPIRLDLDKYDVGDNVTTTLQVRKDAKLFWLEAVMTP